MILDVLASRNQSLVLWNSILSKEQCQLVFAVPEPDCSGKYLFSGILDLINHWTEYGLNQHQTLADPGLVVIPLYFRIQHSGSLAVNCILWHC